jgi:trans-2,3-dihydro-3-hydroxyanthranilate isomerase
MLRLTTLDHVGLEVRDMDRTLHFYQQLGLTLLRTSGPSVDGVRSAVMQVGSQELNIFSPPGAALPGAKRPVGADHFCLTVDAASIDAVIAELRQVGIDVARGPVERRDGTALFLHDPDGVRVELQLKKPSAGAGPGRVRRYPYAHLDVFTERPLTGNQLAVFLEPAGLTAEEMLALTREMGFSETTFVFPAETPEADFRVRIFALNVNREIEVAGHPTIGTVFALARRGLIEPGRGRVVLALGIGPTPVELEWEGSCLKFAWMEQRAPELGGTLTDPAAVAGALGIGAEDIEETRLPVQQVSCGAPFLLVPVATRAAVDRAMLDRPAMARLLEAAGLVRRGVFVFSLEPGEDGATAYSRMFGFGVVEDPATGNASGPLGAYLVHHGVVPPERAGHLVSRQGVRMGRPSEVHIAVTASPAGITSVRIGGSAVLVAEGTLTLPGSRRGA